MNNEYKGFHVEPLRISKNLEPTATVAQDADKDDNTDKTATISAAANSSNGVLSINKRRSTAAADHRTISSELKRKATVYYFGAPPKIANSLTKNLWPPAPPKEQKFIETTKRIETRRKSTIIQRPTLTTAATWPTLPDELTQDVTTEASNDTPETRRSSIVGTEISILAVTPSTTSASTTEKKADFERCLPAFMSAQAKRRVSMFVTDGILFNQSIWSATAPMPIPFVYQPPATKTQRRYETRFCDGCRAYITFSKVQYESEEFDSINGQRTRLCADCHNTLERLKLQEQKEKYSTGGPRDSLAMIRDYHVMKDSALINKSNLFSRCVKKTEEEKVMIWDLTQEAVEQLNKSVRQRV